VLVLERGADRELRRVEEPVQVVVRLPDQVAISTSAELYTRAAAIRARY